ncbi:hypothetical protein [Planomonospora parontospora]|uniref:hypothetical protein n=1 Tax=Planomonospora parontospora TaxID=58119 RepID=UPI0016714375|nr:hypothetical protein [Planomonospora parontospora]GGL56249.1 hypothetical protein GCM10014719_67030 [Planomonospora parontospora subsp. antibiotica]GII19126.1 hypothetical protein Ppa05_58520 [Planomonospora parontospora subsp. antibiotica]
MSSRSLVPGLVAEGDADGGFLSVVVPRQLRELVRASPYTVDVEDTRVIVCGREHLVAALEELAGDCHLIFARSGDRERGRSDGIRYHSHYLVPVVGLGDTEAWPLADPAVWAGLPGSDLSRLPASPADVERIAYPREVLTATAPRRGKPVGDYFEYIGRNIDLAVLARVPGYAGWVAETRNALKGLGYL